MPVLRQLYDSLSRPRELSEAELPFAEFLRGQGLLGRGAGASPETPPSYDLRGAGASPETPPSAGFVLERFAPTHWQSLKEPGIYGLAGDGEGGTLRYHFQPETTPCLGCLWRWWVVRRHGQEWLDRLSQWPDFQLSWPAEAEGHTLALEPGWVEYRRGRRRWLGQLFAHPQCAVGCRGPERWPRHWGSWTHPVSGPLQAVVERRQHGLWRVSLQLPPALASGAHQQPGRARAAAVGEACERWAAWHGPCASGTVRVRQLLGRGHRRCWVGRVFLGPVLESEARQRLSHGLACGPTLERALASAFWELLERDAVRRWWQRWRQGKPGDIRRHSLAGAPNDGYLWSIPACQGRAWVALVGQDGRGAWGSAAGPGGSARALREARHNHDLMMRRPPDPLTSCRSFADHAAWAWNEPLTRWAELSALPCTADPGEGEEWRALAAQLAGQGIGLYFYRLPCFWADRLGWRVVRVLSPQLHGLSIGRSWPPHPFS